MSKILGISGSLRSGSFNTGLLKAAVQLIEGATLEIASIRGIPLYDGDIEEKEGIPQTVQDLKARLIAADGLLLATPEYNNSLPGVLKNAIDWLTRPPKDVPKVFGGKPIAVIGATPGGFGTVLAQDAWLSVSRTLRTRPWFGGRLVVSQADKLFNETGELVDEAVSKQLKDFLRGFVAFIDAGPKERS